MKQHSVDYDVAPDGRRFLLFEDKGIVFTTNELHVVINWLDELARQVPTR